MSIHDSLTGRNIRNEEVQFQNKALKTRNFRNNYELF